MVSRRRKLFISVVPCLLLVTCMYCMQWYLDIRHAYRKLSSADQDIQQRMRHRLLQAYPKNESSRNLKISVPSLTSYEQTVDIDFNIERVFTFGIEDIHSEEKISSERVQIPKILHLMWKDEIIPTELVKNVKSFLEKNPKWDFYFWTDISGRRFIEDHHPNLLQTFDGYHHNTSKADALRIIAMYEFGGAYFDIDTMCLKPLDTIAETEQCIMGPEPKESTALFLGIRSLLASSAFMCIPKHGLFKHLMDNLRLTGGHRDILQAAGPTFVSRQFNSYIQNKILDYTFESFHVAHYELFEGNTLNNQRLSFMKRKCNKPELYDEKQSTSFVYKACESVKLMKSPKTVQNPIAVTVHWHVNIRQGMKQNRMHFDKKNNIRNIIPSIKMYPDL